MNSMKIKGLLLDVGGVLMTNGWDRKLRESVATKFNLEFEEFNNRHNLFNDILELGKITFKEYLEQVVFYKKRSFSYDEIYQFIKDSLKPYPEVIDFFRELKQNYGLKLGLISNESRDLAEDRFKRVPIHDFVDFFIVSGFVGMRKPNPGIYKLALDLLQLAPQEVAYIDDREPYVTFAKKLGLNGIHHIDKKSTDEALSRFIKAQVH